MRINIKCIYFLILLACYCLSANASHKRIEVRTIGFPPYGIEEQGVESGLYYEMANLIVSNAGYIPKNKVAPYARIIRSLKYGEIDLTIMFRNPALEGYVDYVIALPSKKTIVVGLPGQIFNDLADLSGKNMAYLRGAQFNKQIDNDESIEKHLVSDYKLGIQMLMAGRADAIIGPMQSIEAARLELEKINDGKVLLGKPLVVEISTPWIQVSKKSRSYIDIEKIRESFIQLQKENVFQNLQRKYSPDNESQ